MVRLEGVTLLDLVQRSGAVAPWLYLPPVIVLCLDSSASISDRALRILQRCAAKLVRSQRFASQVSSPPPHSTVPFRMDPPLTQTVGQHWQTARAPSGHWMLPIYMAVLTGRGAFRARESKGAATCSHTPPRTPHVT